MATRNLKPRADGEGSIGTAASRWNNGYFGSIDVETAAVVPTPTLNTHAATKAYVDAADAEIVAGALTETIADASEVQSAAAKLARMDTLIPVVKEWDNRRAFAGGVAFDCARAYRAKEILPDGDLLDFDWSVALKISSEPLDDNTQIVFGATDSGTANRLYIQAPSTSKGIRVYTRSGGVFVNALRELTPPSSGFPHYYVVTHTVGVGLKVFRDGLDRATESTGSGAFGALPGFSFGADLNASADNFYTGIIYEGAIFNRALSAAEVTELNDYGLTGYLARHPEDKWGGDVLDGVSTATWDANARTTLTGATATCDVVGDFGVITNPAPLDVGAEYKITYDIDFSLTSAGSFRIANTVNNVATLTGATVIESMATAANLIGELTFTATGAGVFLYVTQNNTIGDAFTVNTFTITKLGALAALSMNEGIGRQLHDLSGRYDALLSETGYEHLQPKSCGKVRVKAADASTAMYMLEASDIIPSDTIVSKVLSEERVVAVANTAQLLDDNRIRLNPSGSDLQIQRSDGTNHTTFGTVTAPTALTDVDVEIHYDQVAR